MTVGRLGGGRPRRRAGRGGGGGAGPGRRDALRGLGRRARRGLRRPIGAVPRPGLHAPRAGAAASGSRCSGWPSWSGHRRRPAATGWSWLSPMGWSQATHPLGDDPVVAAAGPAGGRRLPWSRWPGSWAAAATWAAGWWPCVPGNARAPRSLSGPFGLALRLQRANLVGWVGGVFALGAVYGSLAQGVEDMARGNPTLEEYFRAAGQGSLRGRVPRHDAAGDGAARRRVRGLLGAAARRRGGVRPARAAARAPGLSRTRWMLGLAGGDRGRAARRCCWPGGSGSGRRTRVSRRGARPGCSGSPALAAGLPARGAGAGGAGRRWCTAGRPGWAKVVWAVLAVVVRARLPRRRCCNPPRLAAPALAVHAHPGGPGGPGRPGAARSSIAVLSRVLVGRGVVGLRGAATSLTSPATGHPD